MGWKVKSIEMQRLELVESYNEEHWSVTELCEFYGVSRPTAYKWLERFELAGREGLKDQGRAPHRHPQALSELVQQYLLGVKMQHPYWGARKIVGYLEAHKPEQEWPALSTVNEFLKRRGLTVARRKRPQGAAASAPLAHADAANRVWSIDFKGWFRTGDRRICYPLTLTDNYSRMLLRCQALETETTAQVQPVLAAAFREYGLPERMRSDNGSPFGSTGQTGLTALSVWWIQLGIVPERIERGCPQQNGRHERMHLTLKCETTIPPQANLRKQQQRFAVFRQEYNEERPHEALGLTPPVAHYQPSPRPYPSRVPGPEYEAAWRKQRIPAGGKVQIKHGCDVFVSHALEGQWIGLEPIDDRFSRAWFYRHELGIIDRVEMKFYNSERWRERQEREQRRNANAAPQP
jgi:transposase InsO family protein